MILFHGWSSARKYVDCPTHSCSDFIRNIAEYDFNLSIRYFFLISNFFASLFPALCSVHIIVILY